MFQGINQIEFSKRFYSNEACYGYLVALEWGNGFTGARCGNTSWHKGKTYYHRRCKKCLYDERVTCNTLFHDLKTPVSKAFQMMLGVVTKKKGISTVASGTEVGVQQKAAWFFKRKIQIPIQPAKSLKLENKGKMDETLIGGYCADERGKNIERKEAVMVAIEKLDDGRIGNIAFKHIQNS